MSRMSFVRPGIMVKLSVRIEGGREYTTEDIEEFLDGKKSSKKWKTTRVVEDEEELTAADHCRTAARACITSVCKQTEFGPICPGEREEELFSAVRSARSMIAAFNRDSRFCRVKLTFFPGMVMNDETETARAVATELAELLGKMETGVLAGDAEMIRDACKRAKTMEGMIDDATQAKANSAIESARKAANEIAKRIQRGGELAATVIADLGNERGSISAARFSFLDLDRELEIASMPATERGGLDMDEAPAAALPEASNVRDVEI